MEAQAAAQAQQVVAQAQRDQQVAQQIAAAQAQRDEALQGQLQLMQQALTAQQRAVITQGQASTLKRDRWYKTRLRSGNR